METFNPSLDELIRRVTISATQLAKADTASAKQLWKGQLESTRADRDQLMRKGVTFPEDVVSRARAADFHRTGAANEAHEIAKIQAAQKFQERAARVGRLLGPVGRLLGLPTDNSGAEAMNTDLAKHDSLQRDHENRFEDRAEGVRLATKAYIGQLLAEPVVELEAPLQPDFAEQSRELALSA